MKYKLTKSAINFVLWLTPAPGWHPNIRVKLPTLMVDEVFGPRYPESSLDSSSSSAIIFSSSLIASFSSNSFLIFSNSRSLISLISRQLAK